MVITPIQHLCRESQNLSQLITQQWRSQSRHLHTWDLPSSYPAAEAQPRGSLAYKLSQPKVAHLTERQGNLQLHVITHLLLVCVVLTNGFYQYPCPVLWEALRAAVSLRDRRLLLFFHKLRLRYLMELQCRKHQSPKGLKNDHVVWF